MKTILNEQNPLRIAFARMIQIRTNANDIWYVILKFENMDITEQKKRFRVETIRIHHE